MITLTWLDIFYFVIISYFIVKGIICIFSHIVCDSYIVDIRNDYNNYKYVVRALNDDKAYIKGVTKYCDLHHTKDIRYVKVTKSDS